MKRVASLAGAVPLAVAIVAAAVPGQQPQGPQPYVVGNRLGLPVTPGGSAPFDPMSSNVKVYGAIYSAEKLTRPVQDLIAGTRAVGKGDFGTRLPLPSRDEMGFLVHSFNDMTKRLRRAREETQRSQMAVERERERLAIILARLSTGVITLSRDLQLRSANQAASNILGVDLERGVAAILACLDR